MAFLRDLQKMLQILMPNNKNVKYIRDSNPRGESIVYFHVQEMKDKAPIWEASLLALFLSLLQLQPFVAFLMDLQKLLPDAGSPQIKPEL